MDLDVLLETGSGTVAPAAAAAQLLEDAESARLSQRARDYVAGGYLARFGSGVKLSDPTVSASIFW